MEGYQDAKKTVTFYTTYKNEKQALSNSRVIKINLEPNYYTAYQVVTDPPGAHISYKGNNEYLGSSPTQTRVAVRNSGNSFTREFIIEKAGYQTIKKNITLYPKYRSKKEALENSKKLFVLLRPNSFSNNKSTSKEVSITSDPAGAAVYGNGEYWGTTPITKRINWEGTHNRIELRTEKSEYRKSSRIISSQDENIHFILQR